MDETEARTLLVSWSTSRGRDTYGYNICRLDDASTGKRYRCMGGGYDMLGTVFGEWLQDVAQDKLRAISDRAHHIYYQCMSGRVGDSEYDVGDLYGMTWYAQTEEVRLDGACGIESMRRIAEAIGITSRAIVNRKGHTIGYTLKVAS